MVAIGIGNAITFPRSAGAAVPTWTPAALFASGEQGVWYDPSDFSTLFQDSAGTTPVDAVGQPVGRILDKSGRGNHATQATTAARPILRQSGSLRYLEFDNVDDSLRATFTISQPVTRIAGVNLRSLATANDQIFGGVSANTCALFNPNTTSLAIFSGSVVGNLTIAANTRYVTREVHNNNSSSLRHNNGTPVNGSAGPNLPGGFTMAASNTNTSYFPLDLFGVVMINRLLTAEEIVLLETYMAGKSGATLA